MNNEADIVIHYLNHLALTPRENQYLEEWFLAMRKIIVSPFPIIFEERTSSFYCINCGRYWNWCYLELILERHSVRNRKDHLLFVVLRLLSLLLWMGLLNLCRYINKSAFFHYYVFDPYLIVSQICVDPSGYMFQFNQSELNQIRKMTYLTEPEPVGRRDCRYCQDLLQKGINITDQYYRSKWAS